MTDAYKIPRVDRLPSNLRRSRKQEQQVAVALGGRLTPRSGAGQIKGDVQCKGFARLECKTTEHESFRVTRADLQKLEDHSLGHGELPMFVVRLEGPPILEVAVIPLWALKMLADQAQVNAPE